MAGAAVSPPAFVARDEFAFLHEFIAEEIEKGAYPRRLFQIGVRQNPQSGFPTEPNAGIRTSISACSPIKHGRMPTPRPASIAWKRVEIMLTFTPTHSGGTFAEIQRPPVVVAIGSPSPTQRIGDA